MLRVCLYWTVTFSLVFHKAISIGYEDVTATIVTFDIDDPPPSNPAMTSPSGTSSYPGSPGFVPPAGAGTASIFANAGGMDPAIASLGGVSSFSLETGTTGVPSSIGGSAGVGVNPGSVNSRIGESGTGTGVTGFPGAIGSAGTTENANIGVSKPEVGTTDTVGGSENTLGIPGIINSSGGNLGTGGAGVPEVIGSSGTTDNANIGGGGFGLGTTNMVGGSGNNGGRYRNIISGSGPENLGIGTPGTGVVGDSDGSTGGNFGSTGSENGNTGFSTSNGPFTGNAAISGLGGNPGAKVGAVGSHPSRSALGNKGSGVLGSTSSTGNAGSAYLGNLGSGGNPGNGIIGAGSGMNGFDLPAAGAATQSIVGRNPTSGAGTTRVGGFATNPQLISGNPSGVQASNNPPVIPYNIYATVFANVVPHGGGTSTAPGGSNLNRGRGIRSWRPLSNSISHRRGHRPSPIARRRARINRRRSQTQSIRITIDEGGRISSIRRV